MVARVRVTGGKGQQDVLFPSQELTYGSLVEADEKTFELMKTIGCLLYTSPSPRDS